jgi:hypothetical protein
MNTDNEIRSFRLIEAVSDSDLKRSRTSWELVDGWLQMAERLSPGTPKAVVEGDWIALLPDGARFREVSFKAAHTSVQDALPQWASEAGRRWGRVVQQSVVISDGTTVAIAEINWERVP